MRRTSPFALLSPKARRVFGLILLALAMVTGYFAITLPWVPQTDFDIIGFLYVIENMPRLLAIALTVVLGIGGLGLLFRPS